MENLLNDLKELGLPIIHNYSHGFYYSVSVDDFEEDKEMKNIKLVAGNGHFCISFLDADLTVVTRPSNLIIKCKKCYAVFQKETGRHLGYLYWPLILKLTNEKDINHE